MIGWAPLRESAPSDDSAVFLRQEAVIDAFVNGVAGAAWIPVYWVTDVGKRQRLALYSSLIPLARQRNVLRHPSWDLHISDGRPGCVQRFGGDTPGTAYYRHGDDTGIEPIVFVREFYGMRKAGVELSEEFRLFHNLHFDELAHSTQAEHPFRSSRTRPGLLHDLLPPVDGVIVKRTLSDIFGRSVTSSWCV